MRTTSAKRHAVQDAHSDESGTLAAALESLQRVAGDQESEHAGLARADGVYLEAGLAVERIGSRLEWGGAGQRRAAIRLDVGVAVTAIAQEAFELSLRSGGDSISRSLFHRELREGLWRLFRDDAEEAELHRLFPAPPAAEEPLLTEDEAAMLHLVLMAMRDGRPIPEFDPERYPPMPPSGSYFVES